VGARFSAPVQTGPGAHPASCTMGTGSFPRIKSGRGKTLTPHPLLVPWSRNSRAIPLLPLWAVRPVQSLSACTRVQFSLPFTHMCRILSMFHIFTNKSAGMVLTVYWLCYRLNHQGIVIRFPAKARVFIFAKAFTTPLGPTQPHTKTKNSVL